MRQLNECLFQKHENKNKQFEIHVLIHKNKIINIHFIYLHEFKQRHFSSYILELVYLISK